MTINTGMKISTSKCSGLKNLSSIFIYTRKTVENCLPTGQVFSSIQKHI